MRTCLAAQRRLSEASLPWQPESVRHNRNRPRARGPGVEETLFSTTLAKLPNLARGRRAAEREFNSRT